MKIFTFFSRGAAEFNTHCSNRRNSCFYWALFLSTFGAELSIWVSRPDVEKTDSSVEVYSTKEDLFMEVFHVFT